MRLADGAHMSLSRLESRAPSPPPNTSNPSHPSTGRRDDESVKAGGSKGMLGPSATAEDDGGFRRVLRGIGKEVEAGERATGQAIASARMGKDLSGAELLILQSRIYRYSEAVDLATKLVDRATNGVRTVVQGQ